MPRAVVLGGTGMLGRAIGSRLAADGWTIDATGRDPRHVPPELARAGVRFVQADRRDPAQLAGAVGEGADLLVDCLCYTAADARQLVEVASDVRSTVMISSKGVYVDAAGNHSNAEVAPNFEGPIAETQPTMAPADGDYQTASGYGANKVAAEHVLLDSGLPVTVLRPSKVHGAGALRPREWVFVKRVLDRRDVVLLAHRGAGVDHTTSAANLAALVELVARTPGTRVLNAADPDAPSGLQIARTIAQLRGHVFDEVLLDDDADPTLGRYPWDAAHPIILDMAAASALGYEPVGTFAETVSAEVAWLADVAVQRDGAAQLPDGLDAAFFDSLFDYDAEDAYLAARR